MRCRLSRRKVLATSTASFPAFGVGTGVASAGDCQEPDWLEDSGLDRDDLRNYGKEVIDMETDSHAWIYNAVCMLPMLENNIGSDYYHGVCATYYFDDCGSGNYDAMIKAHGTKIDVTEGSLFANLDPEKIAVFPDSAGPAKDKKLANQIGFTALKGALGLANPRMGAAILAADLMESSISTLDKSDALENSYEYAWGHSNNEWLNNLYHNMAGHAFDFVIDPKGASTVEFDLYHYVGSNDRNYHKSRIGPMFEMENTYTMKQGYGMWDDKNVKRVKLSEEEIERLGLPEEFTKHRPIYEKYPTNASIQTVE